MTTGSMGQINKLQNRPDAIRLLRASSQVHRRIRILRGTRTAISLALAAMSLTAVLVPRLQTAIAVAGFVWIIAAVLGFATAERRAADTARRIQEMFDTSVFELQWTSRLTIEIIPPEDIERHSRAFRGDESRLHNWYPDTTYIPRPCDILLCQRVNMVWDGRLRKITQTSLIIAAALWATLGIGLAIARDMTIIDALLAWFVPSSSMFVLVFEAVRDHGQVAEEKQKLAHRLRQLLDDCRPGQELPTEQVCRSVQDDILELRRSPVRVPQLLYNAKRAAFEQDMRAAAAAVRNRFTEPRPRR